MRRDFQGLAGFVVLFCAASAIWAAPTPVGSEFVVNTHSTSYQAQPSVSSNASGDFVVVWQSLNQDGSGYGIFAQRFGSNGAPAGSEFQVNTYTTYDQRYPSVSLSDAGDFVVVWQSAGQDGSGYGVFAQRFDSAGAPDGSEFQVNTYTSSNQRYPSVFENSLHDFVVVWHSATQDGSGNGIFAQRFDSAGAALGPEFQVNTFTTSQQLYASVAGNASGDFVVVWESYSQDGSGYGIFGQSFDSSGSPVGSEFQVNSYTTGQQFYPKVAMDGAGDFAVVWEADASGSSYFDAVGRFFDSTGAPMGPDFLVSSSTTFDQSYPAIAANDAGNFTVVWSSYAQDGSAYGVFGRRFDSLGAPASGEFQANTFTTGYQIAPTVALSADGGFVVAWESDFVDGSTTGIAAQRFGPPFSITSPMTGDTLDCTDPKVIRPTIAWDPEGYDVFRVFFSPDPAFPKGNRVSSGSTLLKTPTYMPPAKKWLNACKKAIATNPGSPGLFIKVFGIDKNLSKKDPARKRDTPTVHVDVTP